MITRLGRINHIMAEVPDDFVGVLAHSSNAPVIPRVERVAEQYAIERDARPVFKFLGPSEEVEAW